MHQDATKGLPVTLVHPCSAGLRETKIVKCEFAISLGYLAKPCLNQTASKNKSPAQELEFHTSVFQQWGG